MHLAIVLVTKYLDKRQRVPGKDLHVLALDRDNFLEKGLWDIGARLTGIPSGDLLQSPGKNERQWDKI